MSARSREFVAAQAWLERFGVPIALSVNPVARLFWPYRRYCATEASLRVIGLEPTTDDPSGMRSHSNDGGGRRLVAAGDAGRIWRYAVDADDVKLDRLDGKSWDKRKRRSTRPWRKAPRLCWLSPRSAQALPRR